MLPPANIDSQHPSLPAQNEKCDEAIKERDAACNQTAERHVAAVNLLLEPHEKAMAGLRASFEEVSVPTRFAHRTFVLNSNGCMHRKQMVA